MILAVLAAALLLLLASGWLAYQNSRLIAGRKANGAAVHMPPRRYSVFSQATPSQMADSLGGSLFSLRLPMESAASVTEGQEYSWVTLCRDDTGQGEMLLPDAQRYMLNRIRQLASQEQPIEYVAFVEAGVSDLEQELILNLEKAVKEAV
ncbi:hypothetical protein A8L34_11225 [Bacillus sp. FJAT-27264]|uniref:hypothetical protein n=1 Tax=Paenibacillus sp. (strain DSM 101736 / FJAT-27264) TaxID=1850362 RepID=UPI000807B2ED|nr:hypothetical protein [Bacillus sp. FJAT-27264]OBZ14496.1 hypothetical protein A8L34_11225 [Bacillus sp. FJAT-27264]